MFETRVGAAADDAATAYLRPETAQGIFVNFKNVAATQRGFRLPYGVAQIGKAFRNEITPRNFIFRSREFEQMEIEYFVDGAGDAWRAAHAAWLVDCRSWLIGACGLRPELLGEDVHDDLAHYAAASAQTSLCGNDLPGRQRRAHCLASPGRDVSGQRPAHRRR